MENGSSVTPSRSTEGAPSYLEIGSLIAAVLARNHLPSLRRARGTITVGITTGSETVRISLVKKSVRTDSEKTPMTRDAAWSLAEHLIAAWNAHDLDLIMTHYEDEIELILPVAPISKETL